MRGRKNRRSSSFLEHESATALPWEPFNSFSISVGLVPAGLQRVSYLLHTKTKLSVGEPVFSLPAVAIQLPPRRDMPGGSVELCIQPGQRPGLGKLLGLRPDSLHRTRRRLHAFLEFDDQHGFATEFTTFARLDTSAECNAFSAVRLVGYDEGNALRA